MLLREIGAALREALTFGETLNVEGVFSSTPLDDEERRRANRGGAFTCRILPFLGNVLNSHHFPICNRRLSSIGVANI